MCFFLYNPNGKIKICYASESITLLKQGKSEVIADLLISNESEAPITNLIIIYPNQFFDFLPYRLSGKKEDIKRSGEYLDYTESIINKDSPYNWAYKDPKNLISFKLLDGTKKNAEGLSELEVSQPHPRDPIRPQVYKGFIGGKITLSPLSGLTDLHWFLLQMINFSVFEATFDPPIMQNTARWTRWKFNGRSAVVNYHRKHEWLLRYSNLLQCDYQINGMYDVRNRFIELLYVFRDRVKKRSFHADMYNEVEDLIAVFEKTGLSYPDRTKKNQKVTNVEIPDWRLHITPGELGRITDIVMRGNVEVIGGIPNFIEVGNDVYTAYEWKAGPSVTYDLEADSEYSFSIFFQGKEIYWAGSAFLWGLTITFLLLLILIVVLIR